MQLQNDTTKTTVKYLPCDIHNMHTSDFRLSDWWLPVKKCSFHPHCFGLSNRDTVVLLCVSLGQS